LDIVTHILAGRAAGKMSAGTKAAAVAGALGALVPDVDGLVLVFPALEGILERRGGLHSCLGVLLTAVVVTAVISWLRKIRQKRKVDEAAEFETDWEQLSVGRSYLDSDITPDLKKQALVPSAAVFAAAVAGGLTHLLLDVITPWGVPLLWPIDTEFALGLTRGFDPWISGLVLAMTYFTLPNVSSRRRRKMFDLVDYRPVRRRGFAVCAAFFVIAYLALRFYLQAGSLTALPPGSGGPSLEDTRSSYALSALNPFRWRVVVVTSNGYDLYRVVTSKRPQKLLSFTSSGSPCIEKSRSGELVSRYLQRARYPYSLFNPDHEDKDNRSTVIWRDMRDQLFQVYRSDEVQVNLDCGTGEMIWEKKTTWFDRLVGGTFWDPRGPDKGS